MLGLSKSPLTDWKNEKSRPTLDQIIILCEYFSISADYLLFGNEINLKVNISPDQQELLSLWGKLDSLKQAEFKGELKGYIRAKEEGAV